MDTRASPAPKRSAANGVSIKCPCKPSSSSVRCVRPRSPSRSCARPAVSGRRRRSPASAGGADRDVRHPVAVGSVGALISCMSSTASSPCHATFCTTLAFSVVGTRMSDGGREMWKERSRSHPLRPQLGAGARKGIFPIRCALRNRRTWNSSMHQNAHS